MPTYGYQCNACGHQFQKFQSMKDDPIKICPECAGETKRLMYPVGIVFKGSGWYINDSRPADKSDEPAAPVKTETKEGESAKPETAKTETPVAAAPAIPSTSEH